MNKKAFKILRNLRFTLSLINKYKKSYLIGLFILSILLGILPYISLLISQGWVKPDRDKNRYVSAGA